jgi:hypothetical protein
VFGGGVDMIEDGAGASRSPALGVAFGQPGSVEGDLADVATVVAIV